MPSLFAFLMQMSIQPVFRQDQRFTVPARWFVAYAFLPMSDETCYRGERCIAELAMVDSISFEAACGGASGGALRAACGAPRGASCLFEQLFLWQIYSTLRSHPGFQLYRQRSHPSQVTLSGYSCSGSKLHQALARSSGVCEACGYETSEARRSEYVDILVGEAVLRILVELLMC